MTKLYRDGAIGALLDEYERAAKELEDILLTVSNDDFNKIYDHVTTDPDCVSIHSIMNHVIRSGYGYANYIREKFEMPRGELLKNYPLNSPLGATNLLAAMLDYTGRTFINRLEMTEDEMVETVFTTRWGIQYNIEQMLEHAIVHILRHRRQIERFLQE